MIKVTNRALYVSTGYITGCTLITLLFRPEAAFAMAIATISLCTIVILKNQDWR